MSGRRGVGEGLPDANHFLRVRLVRIVSDAGDARATHAHTLADARVIGSSLLLRKQIAYACRHFGNFGIFPRVDDFGHSVAALRRRNVVRSEL